MKTILVILLLAFSACTKDDGACYQFDVTVKSYSPGFSVQTVNDEFEKCGLSESEAVHIARDYTHSENYAGGGWTISQCTYTKK